MAISMKNILKKYADCNKFSLTGTTSGYTITEDDFAKALENIEEQTKKEKRQIYEYNKEKLVNYPEFDELYEEIKQECKDFCCKKNRQLYIKKWFSTERIKSYKEMGISEEKINEMKENFFHRSYIADCVGRTTKYGSEYHDLFVDFYRDISMIIDRQNDKKRYFISGGKNLLEQIPEKLKENFLYYEVSYYNSVTTSSLLMVNYYFKLNDKTKEYLLQFRHDFCLNELEDLALYKDDELKFCSCTHEEFNSIQIDYKDMTIEEITDFINNKYFNEDNRIIIDAIKKIIEMPVNKIFSFQELNISNNQIINIICKVSLSINLNFDTVEKKQTKKTSYVVQLLYEGKYKEAEEEFAKYQPIEGYYEPLPEIVKEDYSKEILFKKIG